jgi:hypothetical protein
MVFIPFILGGLLLPFAYKRELFVSGFNDDIYKVLLTGVYIPLAKLILAPIMLAPFL